MLFNTFEFLWLFPVIFVTYMLANSRRVAERFPRLPNYVLIAISYGVYIKWNPAHSLVLFGVTLVTYVTGLLLERHKGHRRKIAFVCGTALGFLPLLVFKYADFIISQVNALGLTPGIPGLNWALPLGISFFTLQAISYVADVYKERQPAEHNWWDYMLFVCFFPQIASGPIGRAGSLLPQIKARRVFALGQFTDGCRWLLWGMFLKVVLANRIGMVITPIMAQYSTQSSLMCAVAIFLYSMQIYGDFAGYSFMALGVGKMLGFELTNNFNRPYFAQSVSEFWRRWHISLSSWLRDYIYFPLGGSRCSKARCYMNLMAAFLVSGLWHGADWTFLAWGSLHGVCLIFEKHYGLGKLQSHGWIKAGRILLTFVIVTLLRIMFRLPTVGDAWAYFCHLFDGSTRSTIHIAPSIMLLTCLAIVVVLVKDLADEYLPREHTLLHNRRPVVRLTAYASLIVLLLLCGVFDASQFIYARF